MTEIDWFTAIQEGFAAARARKNAGLAKNTGNRGNNFETPFKNNALQEAKSVAPRDLARATRATALGLLPLLP